MKKYTLQIPINGVIYTEVEADSREEAITQACADAKFEDIDKQEWQTDESGVEVVTVEGTDESDCSCGESGTNRFCPYQSEINGVDYECNCCDNCHSNC